MMTSRWDALLDSKPVPIFEHLIEEVSKLIAKDLAGWPPPVTEVDPVAGRKYLELLAPGSPRPSRAAFVEAFQLARLELSHEIEAFDAYMRHKRYLERGLAESDRATLLFLSRWLVDQMTGLGEATEGRVKRKHMLEALERTARRLGLFTASA